MGVQKLNSFINKTCSNCVYKITFKDLKERKIAIDVSMFLYKFKKQQKLIENMYKLCSLMRRYSIHPIFVFDGKPPDEKNVLIDKRRKRKKDSVTKRKLIEEMVEKNIIKYNDVKHIIEHLRSQSVYITKTDIMNVKELLDKYGLKWMESDEEADTLCAYLSKTNKVYGIMSEDTDMFAYGCKNVIQHVNIHTGTMLIYNTEKIYKTLDIDENTFRILCSISKNDYLNGKEIEHFRENYMKLKVHDEMEIENINDNKLYTSFYNMDDVYHYNTINIPTIKNERYSKMQVNEFMNTYAFNQEI